MTKLFERQEFRSWYDRNSGKTFQDLEFQRCKFVSSALSVTLDPRRRSTVRNVKLSQCEVQGSSLWCAIVEEVLVDGLKTSGDFSTWGAVFKHVTLKGKIGDIMINPAVDPANITDKQQRAFDEANAAYYATVDWALDISEAEFTEADIRGVPARLIRRDPETQVVIKREKALDGRWRQLGLDETTYWPTSIEFFLEREEPDVVLVAPKRARNFQQMLAGLQLLRKEKIAEPD